MKILFMACIASVCATCQAYTLLESADGQALSWPVGPDGIVRIKYKIVGAPPEIVRESVKYSTNEWTRATNGGVVFEEGDGDVSIHCDDVLPEGYLGMATFGAVGATILSGRISLNFQRYTFHRSTNTDGYNLDGVVLHELGHILGLGHPKKDEIIGEISAANMPTMNGTMLPGAETLHEDDIHGIRKLYPYEPSSPVIILIDEEWRWNKKKFMILGAGESTWTFGDKSRRHVKGTTVVHRFKRAGTYTITATDSYGKSCSLEITVQKLARRKR